MIKDRFGGVEMSNPKAQKAKALYERIQSADRVGQLTAVFAEIQDDPEFDAMDKMNLGHFVTMRMKEMSSRVLDNLEKEVTEKIKEQDEEPEKAISLTNVFEKDISRLYSLYFVAAEGHASELLRNFEGYMDDVLRMFKIMPEKYNQLLDDYEEYRMYGKHLSPDDDLYWHKDHMGIIRGDIKKIQRQAEGMIAKYYKTEDYDWGFLDLVRRALHAIELMVDHHDEIRVYVDEAKKRKEEEQ